MNAIIRKLSVLTALFSGLFLLINYAAVSLLHVDSGSGTYYFLQIGGLSLLIIILVRKIIQIY